MRFIENGPSIPDDLLLARDAGQVLFFCGAGVSRAGAHLPDFVTLAKQVVSSLGSAASSPAHTLFEGAKSVPTDRIFGMLEREFEPAEVRSTVAAALKPLAPYTLDAHRALLDLSRTPGGVPRLVTTNFDLLFEECEPGISSSNQLRLPDPNRAADFKGIIHLHGMVNASYTRASDDEFVLSSADFGHAYLSDGWATRYIQSLLEHFRIVFVGYSADDPPVQYLLEGLNRFGKPAHPLYAFQNGAPEEAAAQWIHKGVEPIAFDSTDRYALLWDTLSAWAERARDVDGWYDRVIARCADGPEALAPFERGQFAHIASSVYGAKRLLAKGRQLPAEWISVLDSCVRYATPTRNLTGDANSIFDPFDAFSLDGDAPPLPTDPQNFGASRAIPEGAWNGMSVTASDLAKLPLNATAQLLHNAGTVPALAPRLEHLGLWFHSLANQPAALWWAASKKGLHPQIEAAIKHSLAYGSERFAPAVSNGWNFLLASWRRPDINPDLDRYSIQNRAKKLGWSPSIVREAMALYRPFIKVRQASSARAPQLHPELALKEIVAVDIEYPLPHEPFDFPTSMLAFAVAQMREHLEYAIQLEGEVSGDEWLYLETTRPDDGDARPSVMSGLTGHVFTYMRMVTQLYDDSPVLARDEASRWVGVDRVSTRVRIWAAGHATLTSPEQAGRIFLALSDEMFWGNNQRDLLFSLRDRWSELPTTISAALEKRLLNGHIPWDKSRSDHDELVAHYRLNWLYWLSKNGVNFSFDIAAEISALRLIATQWASESGDNAVQPGVSKVRGIDTDRSADILADVPFEDLLIEAEKANGYDCRSGVIRRPFHGLTTAQPAKALRVLTNALRRGNFYPWAWDAFLSAEEKGDSSPRMRVAIAKRVARLTASQLSQVAHQAADWLRRRGELLMQQDQQVFDTVWDALVNALALLPDKRHLSGPNRGWVNEAINMPTGWMIDALQKDPKAKGFTPEGGLSTPWHRRLEQLLSLPGDHRQHAIVILAAHLNWIFHVDELWATQHLLPLSENAGDASEAFWAGYLWAKQAPQTLLYRHLKQPLLELACRLDLRQEYVNPLAGILLAGWGPDEDGADVSQPITNGELREVLILTSDEIRIRMLWHLAQWAKDPDGAISNRLIPFFKNVWPRQRSLRTPKISGQLVQLALELPDRFSEIAVAILPRLVPVTDRSLHHSFFNIDTNIVVNHSRALLNTLCAVLPDDSAIWPYKIGQILNSLREQADMQNDATLEGLIRRLPLEDV